jgi:hypothetical protein
MYPPSLRSSEVRAEPPFAQLAGPTTVEPPQFGRSCRHGDDGRETLLVPKWFPKSPRPLPRGRLLIQQGMLPMQLQLGDRIADGAYTTEIV